MIMMVLVVVSMSFGQTSAPTTTTAPVITFTEEEVAFAGTMSWPVDSANAKATAEKFAAFYALTDSHNDKNYVNMPKSAPNGIMAKVLHTLGVHDKKVASVESHYAQYGMAAVEMNPETPDSVKADLEYYRYHPEKITTAEANSYSDMGKEAVFAYLTAALKSK